MNKTSATIRTTERFTRWVGSVPSLVIHTLLFLSCFTVVWLHWVALDTMLLVLTTIVSLEAIYLAIFIQMTVNENTLSLRGVEEDIDEIQEDVEELGEDVDEIQENIEEMSEEDKEEERREREQVVTLEQLTTNIRQILVDLEALKKRNG